MTLHAPILPILIPLVAALLQLASRSLVWQRVIAAVATLATLAVAAWLLLLADAGPALVYALGDWPAPFGIVLVADRTAAVMVMLGAVLAPMCLLHAADGFDARGRHFHAVFQLQMAGLNGAFLTGDLFNLFVFFEVLLLASYILLAHGGGRERSRAGIAYVVLNLAGSAVFLVALGLVYGTLGTLNLADIAVQLQQVDSEEAALVRLAGALLVSVFALKAALLPLSFWLPSAYSAAGAPVAALFAVMTKLGVYAILRLQTIALAPAAATSDLLASWLLPVALATLTLASLGVLAASRLQAVAAWLVLASAGTLLLAPALGGEALTAAALYYLVQSALMAAALFLLAGLLSATRPQTGDRFVACVTSDSALVKIAFFVLAMTAIGLPPLSGFLGKLMLLEAVRDHAARGAIWFLLLVSGFVTMAALARGGSRLFWERHTDALARTPYPAVQAGAVAGLTAASLLLAVFAQPVAAYMGRAAAQLHNPAGYIETVLGARAHDIARQVRP